MTPPRIRTRSGRKPRARFHASWSPAGQQRARKTLVRALGVLGGMLLVMVVGANVYAVSFLNSLPTVPKNLDSTMFSGDTIIQDRSGRQLGDVGQQGDRRINVSFDQVSPKLIQATVAVEDRNFWTNPGFDTGGILRAATSNFRSGSIVGGGSTITQQLAKQLFLSPEQTFDRKLKEIVLAYQLSQTYTKRQILELYLNHSYYGDQQYGVQAAARTFFHRDARDLDLAQSAMLAGLPQAPDAYSPTAHLDTAKRRQKEVLDAMVREGYVKPQDSEAAFAEHLDVYRPVNSFLAPHFVEYVERELEQIGFRPGQDQLVVKTTLDYGKQQMAEQVVKDNLNANLWRDRGGQLSSAQVAMDPKTGQILTMVGSPDYNATNGQYNFVSEKPVNPGSSVKPFTYAAALDARKATMDTPIADSPNPYIVNQAGGPPYKVTNYDKRTHGDPLLRVALASSLNIPAVKIEQTVGVPSVVDFYRNLGIHPRIGHLQPDGSVKYTTDDPDTSFGASLTLGGYAITLLEEVTALSTIADMGVYHQPEAILQVTDLKGNVKYTADPNRGVRQALNPGVAFIIWSILSDDANRAPIFGFNSPLHLSDRHAAAKTGTTENYKDALTIGFTPDLASVVWVGDILGIEHTMAGNSDGVYVAAPAWHKFMVQALQGVPDHTYDPPPGVVKGPGNSWFLRDTPKVAHLPGDNPSPQPSPMDYGIPGDPGTGPQRVGQRCRIPILPCISPPPGI